MSSYHCFPNDQFYSSPLSSQTADDGDETLESSVHLVNNDISPALSGAVINSNVINDDDLQRFLLLQQLPEDIRGVFERK